MIGLIVARSKNNVIGKNGNIPWKIKGEQKQFRELTTGNVVIMGRKSYEEIGHPLPNRMNIVVSTTTEYQGDNLVSVKSLEDALLLAKGRDVYISGGYGLFKEALQIVDKMYITEVQITLGLEEETEYEIDIAGAVAGTMKTNLGGKLCLSVELEGVDSVDIKVSRK